MSTTPPSRPPRRWTSRTAASTPGSRRSRLPGGCLRSITCFAISRVLLRPYSAWFYIPTSYQVRSWLSLTHFRSSQSGDGNNLVAIWDVNLYSRPDGSLIAHLFDYTKAINVEQANPIPVPIGRWFQFEVLLRKAADATGHVAVWQDGVLILDDPNVPTAPTDWVQWDAGGSSGDIVPSPATIYIDDAAISLSRIGNQGG
jgi:hypothetical protein